VGEVIGIMSFKRDIADLKRFKEIMGIIFEEELPFILEHTRLGRYVPMQKRLIKKHSDEPNEVKVRRTLERLGPSFVKLGQLLSIRPDFVPKSYIQELEKLQEEVPPVAFSEIKKSIEKSTGKKLNELFKRFDKIPVASASIAQVHKAVLKNGKTVAVKVQRPGIQEIVSKDIEIMKFIARMMERHNTHSRLFLGERPWIL